MITLGVETSCDETAVAIADDGRILSSEVSSSVHLHSRYGGVVPEIASRFHTEYIYPVLEKALEDSGCGIDAVDLIAVTRGPGLPGSLLVGMSFAKALSLAGGIPLVGVNHVHAHMLSCFLGREGINDVRDMFPFTGMVISGGHTSIYSCRGMEDFSVIGRTRDDAVGEAFDKVAKVLGLGYPGGPLIEERAKRFEGPGGIDLPRTLLSRDDADLDFSFSGIKTAVMYHWRDCDKNDRERDKICYSFQEAVLDVIDEKVRRAIRTTGARRFAVGGGVVNNDALRAGIEQRCGKEGVEVFLPEKDYCADNAAMIAVCGEALFRSGVASDLYLNAGPGDF